MSQGLPYSARALPERRGAVRAVRPSARNLDPSIPPHPPCPPAPCMPMYVPGPRRRGGTEQDKYETEQYMEAVYAWHQ